jgi:tryptophan-rich sensory protein
VPLALYGTQLALNVAWSPLFFGAKKLGAALVDIGLLDVAVAATAYSLYERREALCWLLARCGRETNIIIASGRRSYGVNETAGLLMVPYLAWISFATLLNYQIWDMNTVKAKPE